MNSFRTFFAILGPSAPDWLDQYCAGLTFGNQGSKMLVKFANLLIPVDKDGKRHKRSARHRDEKATQGGHNPIDDIMAGV